jgi:Protein of unknown function (DUF3892)
MSGQSVSNLRRQSNGHGQTASVTLGSNRRECRHVVMRRLFVTRSPNWTSPAVFGYNHRISSPALVSGFPTSHLYLEATMGRYQITCITKRGSHLDPHERIEYLGNQAGAWKAQEDVVIRWVENGTHSFFTLVNGREADIVVAMHNGRKYLKTTPDGYRPDNLLSLSECENCKLTT